MINQVLQGDCLEVLKTFPDNYFDSLVTDPPAGISFMGKDFDKDKGGMLNWINWLSEVMNEAMRTMKPGALGLVWSIPRTSHWTGMALELAGFRLIDVIHVASGQGFPKGQDIGKMLDSMANAEREIIGPSQYAKRGAISSSGSNDGWKRPSHESHTERMISAPSTEEAKHWDGWKSAQLKPSIEGWWLIEKPRFTAHFNLESKDAIIEWNTLIQYFVVLCLSVSNAEAIFSHPEKGFVTLDIRGQRLGSVLENVVNNPSIKSVITSEKTDTFRSLAMGKIALSIVSLWNSISEEVLTKESISTTSTVSSLITELKTCYLLTLQSISQNTIHHSNNLNAGNSFIVQSVELFLKGRNQLPKKAITSFVAENVLNDIGIILLSSLVKIAERNLVEKDTIENSVQLVVGLNPTKKQDSDKSEKLSPVNAAEKKLKCGNPVKPNTVVESAWDYLLLERKKDLTGKENVKPLSPPVEGWWLIQKPISESSIARNILKHGVGGINVEACRIETNGEQPKGSGCRGASSSWDRQDGGMFDAGRKYQGNITPATGRYPANLVLSCGANCIGENHSPDCPVTAIGDQSGECNGGAFPKKINGSSPIPFRTSEEREERVNLTDKGTAARFFKQLPFDPETIASIYYQAKASKRDRSCNGEVNNNHPTVKSTALMEYFIKLITPPNGIVLDCFGGSGTTAIAAIENGFNYVLIEKEDEYFEIIKQRIAATLKTVEPTLEERVQWLETQVQAQNSKIKKLESKNQQLSLFG